MGDVTEGRAARRALVVEDEALIALDTQDALERMGFGEVAVAATYEEASAALDEGGYDLVVFDLNLDGVSCLPLVEARAATGRPTLVTSGDSARGLSGGVTVLPKPTPPGALDRSIGALGL